MAIRFCLSHTWPQPQSLLLSPHWEQKGNLEGLGETQDGPDLSPHPLPNAAQGTAQWEWPMETSPAVCWSEQHPQQGTQSYTGYWGQPLLHPGLFFPGVLSQHSPALQGTTGPVCPMGSPLLLLGAPISSPAQTLRCFCHTSGRASTARTPQGGNLQLWNTPHLQRDSKPCNTTARHPSQCGEDGEKRGFML